MPADARPIYWGHSTDLRTGYRLSRPHRASLQPNPPHAPCKTPAPWKRQHSVGALRVTCSSDGIAYRCLTCTQPLREMNKNTLVCDNGHTTLRAKEGYVHLRPSGRKAAANAPGDSSDMVRPCPLKQACLPYTRFKCKFLAGLLGHYLWQACSG